MSGPRRLSALLGAVVLVLAACGGSDGDLNLRRAEQAIRARSEASFGDAVVGRVRCPGRVEQRKGATFGCTVQVDDVSVPLVVRQTNDAGTIHIDLAVSVLSTEKVERFIKDYAAQNREQVQSVDCGSTRYLLRARGSTVECEVVRADGSRIPSVVGVRDTRGSTAIISYGPTKDG